MVKKDVDLQVIKKEKVVFESEKTWFGASVPKRKMHGPQAFKYGRNTGVHFH